MPRRWLTRLALALAVLLAGAVTQTLVAWHLWLDDRVPGFLVTSGDPPPDIVIAVAAPEGATSPIRAIKLQAYDVTGKRGFFVGCGIYPLDRTRPDFIEWTRTVRAGHDGWTTSPTRERRLSGVLRERFAWAWGERDWPSEGLLDGVILPSDNMGPPQPLGDGWDELWPALVAHSFQSGWPWLSMELGSVYNPITDRGEDFGLWQPPIWFAEAIIAKGRPLPATIIWPNALANTAVYAAFWALIAIACITVAQRLLRTIRRVRSLYRIGQGLCPACGYEARNLPTCPECGSATRPLKPSTA